MFYRPTCKRFLGGQHYWASSVVVFIYWEDETISRGRKKHALPSCRDHLAELCPWAGKLFLSPEGATEPSLILYHAKREALSLLISTVTYWSGLKLMCNNCLFYLELFVLFRKHIGSKDLIPTPPHGIFPNGNTCFQEDCQQWSGFINLSLFRMRNWPHIKFTKVKTYFTSITDGRK